MLPNQALQRTVLALSARPDIERRRLGGEKRGRVLRECLKNLLVHRDKLDVKPHRESHKLTVVRSAVTVAH